MKEERKVQILDARFDYEFKGGHIAGAINFTDLNQVQAFFFSNKEQIEHWLIEKIPIVIHCEFS